MQQRPAAGDISLGAVIAAAPARVHGCCGGLVGPPGELAMLATGEPHRARVCGVLAGVLWQRLDIQRRAPQQGRGERAAAALAAAARPQQVIVMVTGRSSAALRRGYIVNGGGRARCSRSSSAQVFIACSC
jgi:hypothetical protein